MKEKVIKAEYKISEALLKSNISKYREKGKEYTINQAIKYASMELLTTIEKCITSQVREDDKKYPIIVTVSLSINVDEDD